VLLGSGKDHTCTCHLWYVCESANTLTAGTNGMHGACAITLTAGTNDMHQACAITPTAGTNGLHRACAITPTAGTNDICIRPVPGQRTDTLKALALRDLPTMPVKCA
jgi:hypothetical protein